MLCAKADELYDRFQCLQQCQRLWCCARSLNFKSSPYHPHSRLSVMKRSLIIRDQASSHSSPQCVHHCICAASERSEHRSCSWRLHQRTIAPEDDSTRARRASVKLKAFFLNCFAFHYASLWLPLAVRRENRSKSYNSSWKIAIATQVGK